MNVIGAPPTLSYVAGNIIVVVGQATTISPSVFTHGSAVASCAISGTIFPTKSIERNLQFLR
jgi:hypothetical protein